MPSFGRTVYEDFFHILWGIVTAPASALVASEATKLNFTEPSCDASAHLVWKAHHGLDGIKTL